MSSVVGVTTVAFTAGFTFGVRLERWRTRRAAELIAKFRAEEAADWRRGSRTSAMLTGPPPTGITSAVRRVGLQRERGGR